MKRRTAIWIGIIAGLVLLGAVTQIFRICRAEMLREQAEAMAVAGEYAGAMALYDRIGDKERAASCEDLRQEGIYQEGIAFFLAGDYDGARQLFSALGSYKEAPALTAACGWQEALALEDWGKLIDAHRGFQTLAVYPDCREIQEQISGRLYRRAEEQAARFRLEEACEIWEELGSYEDSALLLRRGQRALVWASAPEEQRLLTEENRYLSQRLENVYILEQAYLVVPENWGEETQFFIYYPGGRDEEMSLDYLLYYMMNPSPNTLAVFLRQNGLTHMRDKTCQAIDLLEQAAAEGGVFVRELVAAGSSLGAYPAMHSAVYAYEEYGIRTDCVLSLDAGSDWLEESLLLTEEECRKTAQLGTAFYLFESPWVGMNRDGIRLMVNTGNQVTMVGCTFDDHVRISLDAMGMGVVDWAVGDRAQPCNSEIYSFTRLEPDEGEQH